MKLASIVTVAMLACSGGAPAKQPIGNVGPAPDPAPLTVEVSGTLTDDAGTPMPGTTIVFEPVVKHDGDPTIVAVVGNDGRYVFPEVPVGRYTLILYFAETSLYRSVEITGPSVIDQHLSEANLRGSYTCTGVAFTSCTRSD